MGAPSPCPVMPPRVKVVCRVSRYALEDMVVVQVCCRWSRTILVVSAAAGAASATEAAAGATDAVFRKLRRFIFNSDLFQSSGSHQQFGPIVVVEVVDAHHRSQVGGGGDEFSVPRCGEWPL